MAIKKKAKKLINALRDLIPKNADYDSKTAVEIDNAVRNSRNLCEEILLELRNDIAEEKVGIVSGDVVTIEEETGEFTFVGVCSDTSCVCKKGQQWDVYQTSTVTKKPTVAPASVPVSTPNKKG